MQCIDEIILEARQKEASDIHMTAGEAVRMRIRGKLENMSVSLTEAETEAMLCGLMNGRESEKFAQGEDVDFALSLIHI